MKSVFVIASGLGLQCCCQTASDKTELGEYRRRVVKFIGIGQREHLSDGVRRHKGGRQPQALVHHSRCWPGLHLSDAV
jgi:hypothetical protein